MVCILQFVLQFTPYLINPPISTQKDLVFQKHLGAPGWLSRLSNSLLISAQVMISTFVRQSPTLGSMLGVESAWDSVSPAPSATLPYTPSLSQNNYMQLKKDKSMYIWVCVSYPINTILLDFLLIILKELACVKEISFLFVI